MESLPDYAQRNREAWSKWAPDWVEMGRKSWSEPDISWGIWSVPESEVQAFGELSELKGKDVLEMGCGTAYFSAWMAKLGANPVGIDITPGQLASARSFQQEFGIEFPLIEGTAEEVPLPDARFDVALSEYGASIWCDPHKWIPEAARLLRPGGRLVFLRNGTLSMLCTGPTGPAQETLQRDYFGMYRLEWEDGDTSVEFHLPFGEMVRLLRKCGFEIENMIEIQAPADASETRFEYMTHAWARRWPSEEIWVARLK
ncbi:MAG TPA: class I SAM-dependent methyltransferase [Fimbriimonadaceae bacterium]|nr:class I SAM-dependent methyltransferase [Fimbriimonadaceae bacterium]